MFQSYLNQRCSYISTPPPPRISLHLSIHFTHKTNSRNTHFQQLFQIPKRITWNGLPALNYSTHLGSFDLAASASKAPTHSTHRGVQLHQRVPVLHNQPAAPVSVFAKQKGAGWWTGNQLRIGTPDKLLTNDTPCGRPGKSTRVDTPRLESSAQWNVTSDKSSFFNVPS